jgi:hypothetical protein
MLPDWLTVNKSHQISLPYRNVARLLQPYVFKRVLSQPIFDIVYGEKPLTRASQQFIRPSTEVARVEPPLQTWNESGPPPSSRNNRWIVAGVDVGTLLHFGSSFAL